MSNFAVKTVDHLADRCLIKQLWQWDAVDDDRPPALIILAHLFAPGFLCPIQAGSSLGSPMMIAIKHR
ncbi:hypothetical protein, partial [Mesorhizobium sp. M7A.F.Ca.US.001.04.2.1]|uniref:hypothetical protein n=1 Tax=Mesorhizobium sp. M7A.F.Ca.US.001.04.2.1 TaxID=2496727 RepID=UPI0019D31F75